MVVGEGLPLPPNRAGEEPGPFFRHPLCGDTPQRPEEQAAATAC